MATLNIDQFFDKANAKTWRKNMTTEASLLFDQLVQRLVEKKDEVVEAAVENVKAMQDLKLEDSEEFEYSHFQKWLDHYMREAVSARLEDADETE